MKPVLSGIDASSTEISKTTSYAGKISQASSALQPSSTPPTFIWPSTFICSQPSSSGTQKVKKKQAVLDNLFLKKRKFAEKSGDEEAQIHNQQPKKRPSSSLVQKESFSKLDSYNFPTDIANYEIVSSLTDERKYHILCNVWRPSATYTFPLDNDKMTMVELISVASVFTKGEWSFLHELHVVWFGM